MKTNARQVAADVSALLRARNPLLWIVTPEEARAERSIFEAAANAGYTAWTHDVAQGPCDIAGRPINGAEEYADPVEVLKLINARAEGNEGNARGVWILRDFAVWLDGPQGAATLRRMRNLTRKLPTVPRDYAQALIVVTPNPNVPPELRGHATVIDWPLPDREEIAAILDAAIAGLPESMRAEAADDAAREAAIDAAIGLNGEEAASCYAKSLVQTRKIDPAIVNAEKRRVIARERILEICDPLEGGFDSIGGNDNIKAYARLAHHAYSAKAREYGLPSPKGLFLTGVPGCAKSMTAKAIAYAWGLPLIRFDMGALKSKFVGESEANIRRAFEIIAAMGRCIVWFDEIEKALSGAVNGGSDGGVSSDAMGALLVWLEEGRGDAFVIATANDIEPLMQSNPELFRRFDALFFVDTPNAEERPEVLRAALRKHKREGVAIDVAAVAEACDGFTGAEIANIVPAAMFEAFADDAREITTADLIAQAAQVVPLTRTAAERINGMRAWAVGRAKPASRAVAAKAETKAATRSIDF